MTKEELLIWYDKQPRHCCICKKKDIKLCIDHNHKTGTVRGLLCIGCNNYLGRIEQPNWLKNALEYLGIG